MHYHVGHNTPGYLPESDIYTTADAESAVAVLTDDMALASDHYYSSDDEDERNIGDEYSDAIAALAIADVTDGYLTYLSTSTSAHDLGCAYWLTTCTDDDCEIEEVS